VAFAGQVRHRLVKVIFSDIRNSDFATGSGENAGLSEADARSTACNECHLACYRCH
jgi:hypothetical protein